MSRCTDEGQASVELALVLPVVALVVLAVVQVGLVARSDVLTAHAAREAVRVLAVGESEEEARKAAIAAGPFPPGRVEVEFGGTGDRVEVTVVFTESTDVPLAGALMGDVTHVATATMRIEE